jgi:hypothetical protein
MCLNTSDSRTYGGKTKENNLSFVFVFEQSQANVFKHLGLSDLKRQNKR